MKRPRHLRLVSTFALGSMIAFVVIGTALAVVVSRQLRNRQEAFARFHAQFVADSILRYEMVPSDLAAPLPVGSTRYQALHEFVDGRILIKPVVRVKIWARDGTVLFSDEPRLVGMRFAPDDDLAEGFAGETIGSVTDLSEHENIYERALAPKLYSTYTPLWLPGQTGRPAAIVEIYQDYAGIQSEVNTLFRTLAITLLVGLSALYLILLPISRQAGRTIQEQNETLEGQAHKLEELLRTEQQRVADLREVNRLKDEFVAISSHELRTPLTSIIGYAKTLRRPEFAEDPDSRVEFVQAIERQADRLHRLVQNLLAASHLDADARVAANDDVRLAEVASEAVAALGAEGRRVSVTIPDDLPAVRVDRQGLELVVANLLDNALKFSPEETGCELGARVEGDAVAFWVRDYGVGISREQLPRIFDRFYQADSSRTRRYGGVGLGLSLVKGIVTNLGGGITVTSKPGEGSTFTITIPLDGAATVGGDPAMERATA